MDNNEEIQQDFNEEDLEMELIQAEEDEIMLEDNSQRMIERQEQQVEANPQAEITGLQPVRNPISPYMIFVSSWKQNHPEQKFNMSTLGHLWKIMELTEKEPFETQYKAKKKLYQEYQIAFQLLNPNATTKDTAKSLFPLHRIRAIMKQDPYYTSKVESISTMAKGTQFFAQFLLEEVKRMSEGKNRIDYTLLYDCINNVRSLSFLECLIEDHNRDNGDAKPKKAKPEIQLEMDPNERPPQKIQLEKAVKPVIKKTAQPKMPVNQRNLDFFVTKQS